MEAEEYLFEIPILGHHYGFSKNIIIQWAIIVVFALVAYYLTRNLKKVPGKKQNIAELIVQGIESFISEIMGPEYKSFAPYVGSLIMFLLTMNLTGLFGIHPPTKDFSVALGMALTTFLIIQAYAIGKVGIAHYFGGLFKPFFFLAPMNVLERVLLPVSLSLRLFGNITAGVVIMGLIYEGLGSINWFAQLGLPIIGHVYFDIFDGTVQMIVFTMLTMINIKIISEH
ncbi:F0F1 ATP synthase subunit A [Clostridium swellfunianum]|uniref:F0F1 ATP synthase subunit A n=1 Tax=Clostridium swellfunianum TaxID=1367462 RepID=UPI00202F9F61|nr:F0F1 ATP synthase subunit A [Clostridium swellfunianum]